MARQAIEYLVGLVETGGPYPADYGAVSESFSSIMNAARIGALSSDDVRDMWQEMGEAFGSETMQGHGIRKPYGYAGDFEMIDRIYQYSVCDNPVVRRWDEYFQSRKACEAVRNRKRYFIDLMSGAIEGKQTLRVLNVGSGPARDILEYYEMAQEDCVVSVDCVDMDEKAINYATDLCSPFLNRITFHQANIFKWRANGLYDFIWSAGLFDYLKDDAFKALYRRLAVLLNPSGRLVVGNFSPENPTRDYMEFGEWNLHHRSKVELIRLAESCEIPQAVLQVEEEPQGINLFLHLQRST
jgi:SAM-dependent methyltransferase